MKKMHKRAGIAWAMLLALLAWWHTSPAEALETWTTNGLSEASAPAVISRLNQAAATAPQVYIVSPRPEEVIADTNVAVQLQVSGTAIFKNAQLGLGPHLHLLLDRVPTESIYDLNSPITLNNLSPGTHTLQVLANKPWHESWKNPQAFAQVTFHVLAKSADSPNAQAPQLISVQPTEVGTEPWLLDFYVANAPSHVDNQHPLRAIADWRVRVTVNEQSFEVNRDEPIYLRGLRPGVNVLKLEYLNAQGQVADSAVRAVRYQPNGSDGLSRLVRNELSIDQALTLLDPQSQFSITEASPSTQQLPRNQVVPSMPQGNPFIQNNLGVQGSSGTRGYQRIQNNSEPQGYPGIQNNSGTQNYPGVQGSSGTQGYPRVQGNSGTQSYPGVQGNSGTQNYPGVQGSSETRGYPGILNNSEPQSYPGVQGNSGTQGYPGIQNNSGTQSYPGIQGNSRTQGYPGIQNNSGTQNYPGVQSYSGIQNNSEPQSYPGIQRNSGTQGYSGIQRNSGTQGYSGIQNNSGVQSYPGIQNNSRTQNYPEAQGNLGAQSYSGIQNNSEPQGYPGIQNNSGVQSYPGIQNNSGTQNYPEAQGNLGTQNYLGMQSNLISPAAPPSKDFSSSGEISQSKPPPPIARGANEAIGSRPINQEQQEITTNPQNSPPHFFSKESDPPVQPSSPNPRAVTEPKKPIADPEAVAPPVTNPSKKTLLTPQVLPDQPFTKIPVIPSSKKTTDLKVMGQKMWHTASAKIKHFTNQVPPLFNSWSESFRHWLSDRMAAMRASSSPTTSVESAQPTAVRE